MLLLPLTLLITPLLISLGAALSTFIISCGGTAPPAPEMPTLRWPRRTASAQRYGQELPSGCAMAANVARSVGSQDNPGAKGLLGVSTPAPCPGQGLLWGWTVLLVKVLESRRM